MGRYGFSIHGQAALVLARRLLGFSHGVPRLRLCALGKGVCVAFTELVGKRMRHVWTLWGAVLGLLGPVLVARYRLGKHRRRPNPVQAALNAGTLGVA